MLWEQPNILLLLGLVGLSVGLFLVTRSEFYRRGQLAKSARQVGLQPDKLSQKLFGEWMGSCPIVGVGGTGSARNVLVGKYRGFVTVVFDYHVMLGTKQKLMIAAFQLRRGRYPSFALWPRMIEQTRQIAASTEAQEVELQPPRPGFSDHYEIHSPNPQALQRIFAGNLVRFFAKNRDWSVEAGGQWLLIYRFDKRPAATGLHAFVWEAFQIFRPFAVS